jgi:hypothetical protein
MSAASTFDWSTVITDATEIAALAAFKTAIAAIADDPVRLAAQAHHDGDLMRFLRARELDIEKSVALLVEAVVWRLNTNPEALIDSDEPGLVACRQLRVMWTSERPALDGKVVIYMKVRYNPHAVESRINHMIAIMEEAVRKLDANPPQTQMIWIASFERFARSPGGRAVAQGCLDVLQKSYAERLGGMWILNAPWLFGAMYTLLSPFVSSRTKEKLHWLNGDEAAVRAALATVVGEVDADLFT